MGFDTYTMEHLVKLRLEDARRLAAREALVAGAVDPARRWRVRLGVTLIRAGQRLAGEPRRAPRLA